MAQLIGIDLAGSEPPSDAATIGDAMAHLNLTSAGSASRVERVAETTPAARLPSGPVEREVAPSSPPFLRNWLVTDIAWPSPLEAANACFENVQTLRGHGVGVTSGVDAFNIDAACRNLLDIHDVNQVGLVLWSGIHPRRHDGMQPHQVEEFKALRWSQDSFISSALDVISSALPQATVIACDKGPWADACLVPLDHKPLATFQTFYGTAVGGKVFETESSGFDGRHLRRCNTDAFVGLGLVGPLLHKDILGHQRVDIPELAINVAATGLYVLFVGEYTCAQACHCLGRALMRDDWELPRRMMCDRPWVLLPEPRRKWKRGSDMVSYRLEEYRKDAANKLKRRCTDQHRIRNFSDMHAAHNWTRSMSKGRAGISDYGDTMWPAEQSVPGSFRV